MSTISSDVNVVSQGTPTEPTICRDFLRNVCKRGRRCKFWHPTQMECEKIRRSERIFCHDYQNSICRRPACKFLHYSREDEEIFRLTGRLPNELDKNTEGPNPSTPTEEMPPVCKDYLNGICSRGPTCKYRHISAPADKRPHPANKDNLIQLRLDRLPEDSNISLSSAPAHNASVLSNPITSRGIITLQPPTAPTLMAVATSLPNSDRSHSSQSLSLCSNVVSGLDSVLTPVKDVYMSNNAPPTPLVGVVDHVGLPSSSIQHTLYAHPHSLGTFTPLVSVSSTTQPVPCSSVLAVVAESSHHPTAMLQHPSAVATSRTTYHLLSNTPTPMQPHLLSSSTSVSSAPTLLTFPLPQFACDNTQPGTLLSSHGNPASSTPQHQNMLTSVLPASNALTNTSGTCFSSYNVLQLTPSSAVETHALPVFATQHPVSATVTTSVSSTSAALAAAAAAGYWAQHLPVVAGTPGNVTVSASSSHLTPTVTSCSEHDLIESRTHESAALAAAANLPAVSAAAAAAVAAAKAFVARTTPVSAAHAVCYSDTPQCRANNRQDTVGMQSTNSVKTSVPSSVDETQAPLPASGTTTTTTVSAATVAGPLSHSQTTSPAFTSSHPASTNSCFLHQNEEAEEQHAKTAAAVAAAACIGAMFSHPLGTSSSTSSSVAAMLGDLMGQNHLKMGKSSTANVCANQTRFNHNSGETNISCTRSSSDDHKCTTLDNEKHQTKEPNGSRTYLGHVHDSNQQNSLSMSQSDISVSMADDHSSSLPPMDFTSSSAWSSVATTVASAAQAAVAAAVVATQAVSRSAKFFQLTRQKQYQPEATSNPLKPDFPCFRGSVDAIAGDSSNQSVTQSPPTDPGRSSLSPNTAVKMTAAVMAAAAATAAAKQRRILSEVRHSPYAECTGAPCAKQPRITLSPQHLSDTEGSEYNIPCDSSDRYEKLTRRLKLRSGTERYDFVRLKRNAFEVDEDDEEPDAFEDDVDTAMSIALSPEITPPYELRTKMEEHRPDHLDVVYRRQTDDSRPASGDTSPSDPFDGEHFGKSRLPLYSSSHTRAEHKLESSVGCPAYKHSGLINKTNPVITVTDIEPCISGTVSLSAKGPTVYRPLAIEPKLSCLRLRRSRSQPISSCSQRPATLRRAHSSPFVSGHSSDQFVCLPNVSSEVSSVRSTAPSVSTSGTEYVTTRATARNFSASPEELHSRISKVIHGPKSSSRHRLPASRLTYHSHSTRKSLSRPPHVKPSTLSRSVKSVKKMVVQQRSDTRSQATASPDSIMTEDLSGHDDVDDPDTEDYEDELFDLRAPSSSLKRPAPLVKTRWKLPGPSSGASCSASMRKHHALKAENARLRRKLSDLMRQRGDLRAANEILLQQNARLRHSSKRVSAVARMAESATKIIEAHNKSQLSQQSAQSMSPSVFSSAGAQMAQTSNHFSLTHAAAAAAVAAVAQQGQHQSTLHGAYVSSPTASTTQQASQAVATLGGHHLFPSAMVTGSVPGAIALSTSHQPLTAVHLQPATNPSIPTSIAPQPSTIVQQQPVEVQHNSVSSFYPHHLHPMSRLPGTFTSITPHSNLAPASGIQVCHYPIRSSGTVFPSLHQATAVTPSIVPVGASSGVTLLVGQAPYAPVGSTAALHLSSTMKTEPATVNIAPVPQLPFMYQGPPVTLGSGSQQCLSASPLSVTESVTVATNNMTAVDPALRHLDTRPNIV